MPKWIIERKYNFFEHANEVTQKELGDRYIYPYLDNGKKSRCFAVATDENLYFVGRFFYRKSLISNWGLKKGVKAVDIDDITDITCKKWTQYWALIVSIIYLVCAEVMVYPWFFYIVGAGLLIWFLLTNIRVLTISYRGGGSVALRISWYDKEDIEEFVEFLSERVEENEIIYNLLKD